jgi:hypothetical protein
MPYTISAPRTFPLEHHLPGLEATQGLPNGGPIAYTPVSFAATREYADEEGWIRVRNDHSKNRSNNRRPNRT